MHPRWTKPRKYLDSNRSKIQLIQQGMNEEKRRKFKSVYWLLRKFEASHLFVTQTLFTLKAQHPKALKPAADARSLKRFLRIWRTRIAKPQWDALEWANLTRGVWMIWEETFNASSWKWRHQNDFVWPSYQTNRLTSPTEAEMLSCYTVTHWQHNIRDGILTAT